MIPAKSDRSMIIRALALARRGIGAVRPNPMVGAIVHDRLGSPAGAGFHRRAGGKHAEIEALDQAGRAAQGGTLYVTLEPCNHHGRTPPCVERIIKSGIRRVVIAMRDPNPKVSGGGAEVLAASGIEVVVGVAETEAARLNRPWITWITTGRPLVLLKLAVTEQYEIAPPPDSGRCWITGEPARRQVHRLRGWCDAVLVGSGTVAADNPELTNRSGKGSQPLRVIIDSHLRIEASAKVFDKSAPTLVFSTGKYDQKKSRLLQGQGVEHRAIDSGSGSDGMVDIRAVIEQLGQRGVQGVLCEPGPKLAAALLEKDLVDQLIIYRSPDVFGPGSLVFPRDLLENWPVRSGERLSRRIGRDTIVIYDRAVGSLEAKLEHRGS